MAKAQKKKNKSRKVVAPGGARGGMTKLKGKFFHGKQPGHHKRSKLVLQELSKSITRNEAAPEQVPQTAIDIPLHLRSGRNVNRHEVSHEFAQKQTQDISQPQSSGSNIEQPGIVEAVLNAQNLVQDVANPIVVMSHLTHNHALTILPISSTYLSKAF
ncbi:uncharacterized protein LOC129899855 [Solanum dulcamara]|uniref:uncharacterized protein LOC129899855 n=1 Tax=Solanum dulcamara TaxID=45834 RepID=UPI00248607D6|nr:uncharacterized protein LOC129899855 [Solanum dulcamara]